MATIWSIAIESLIHRLARLCKSLVLSPIIEVFPAPNLLQQAILFGSKKHSSDEGNSLFYGNHEPLRPVECRGPSGVD